MDREDTSRLFVLSSQQLSKSLRTTGYRNAGIIERAKLSRYYLRVQAGLMPQSVSSTDGIPYVILSPSRLRWPTYKKFSTLFPPGLYSRSPTHARRVERDVRRNVLTRWNGVVPQVRSSSFRPNSKAGTVSTYSTFSCYETLNIFSFDIRYNLGGV